MISEMLSMGGPMVLVSLLAGGVGGLFAVVVALAIGFAKWRVPMSIGWVGLTTAILAGSIGSAMANMNVEAALSAPMEMRQALMAALLSQGIYGALGAFMVTSVSFFLFTLAASVPTAIAVGPDARFDLRGLLSGVAASVVMSVLSAIGIALTIGVADFAQQGISMLVLPALTTVLTLVVLFASIRKSETDRMHQGREAASRAVVATGAFFAVLLAGYVFDTIGQIQVFKAVAMAPAESKAVLLAAGMDVARLSSLTGWWLAIIPLGTGLASLSHVVGRVEGRQWAGLAVAGVQTVILLGGVWYMRHVPFAMMQSIWPATGS